jgi:vacuolar-type H+-ATPase subunit H
MDIQHLVDRLEDLIDEGWHIPLGKYTVIDEERALEIIDQMRISVPEQIEKASRLINQRDRLIAQANEEATRIVELARERSDELTNRDAIVQTAQHRANNILEQARREAEAIRAEADNYVMEVLKELEAQLIRNLTVTRNGIAKVVEERETTHTRLAAATNRILAEVNEPQMVDVEVDAESTNS